MLGLRRGNADWDVMFINLERNMLGIGPGAW
jgi:hypothetical protein